MGKIWLGIMAVVVLLVSTMGYTAPEVSAEGVKDVELTVEQKDEMSRLHQSALEQKVNIINKYVEYGVFTEEKGQKIIGHMEERYKELQENNFIPDWDMHKKHKEKHDH